MANSNLHSACDIHSKCGENHVNGDDFVFRKISNLFFHRNQILWQYNFSKWLNGCTKTLFVGGSTTRFKKTISYFGGASTLMLLLIFSALISGPGEAYPVEGGMYTRTSSLHWQYNMTLYILWSYIYLITHERNVFIIPLLRNGILSTTYLCY